MRKGARHLLLQLDAGQGMVSRVHMNIYHNGHVTAGQELRVCRGCLGCLEELAQQTALHFSPLLCAAGCRTHSEVCEHLGILCCPHDCRDVTWFVAESERATHQKNDCHEGV